MYGQFDELLGDSEKQIAKARKKLGKLYKYMDGAYSIADIKNSLLDIELILLEGLSSIEEKDKKCIDGEKHEPKWVIRDRKRFGQTI